MRYTNPPLLYFAYPTTPVFFDTKFHNIECYGENGRRINRYISKTIEDRNTITKEDSYGFSIGTNFDDLE